MSDLTIPQMFHKTVQRHADRPAIGWMEGDRLVFLTYGELLARVREVRRGLASLGVNRGDRVAILSENRVEWAITDLATQCLGAVNVAIYPTLPTAQVEYLVRDSAARVLVVSDSKQLAKATALRPNVRTLEHVVCMNAKAPDGDVISFAQLAERGAGGAPSDEELDARVADLDPDETATLIYTSGTTGEPKGAMLSHRALLHTGWAATQIVRLDENDVFLSFLPLCHVFERVASHYLPLSVGAQIVYSQGAFAIATEFRTVRPTIFCCVPRLFEAIQDKVEEHIGKLPDRRRRLVRWAVGAALRGVRNRNRGGIGAVWPRLQALVADRLVISKMRERATGGRVRFFVSGGAPLNASTAEFFSALGAPILEGYGLTEIPVISLNRPGRARIGTVGEPLPGIEVRIAADGEILSRGPALMRGYFGKPEQTREAIDEEGWFHTGDIGKFEHGVLSITDRKKDIIVLANGKNVAPQPIEKRLKESPYIAEVVLIGDRQSTISALVVPDFDRLRAWAKNLELDTSEMAALTQSAEVRKLLREEIDRLSGDFADFERVKRFAVLSEPFSIEGGELTPTLKLRRKVILEKHADRVAALVR